MITDYDKIDFSFTVYWLFRRISVDMEGLDANLGFINELYKNKKDFFRMQKQYIFNSRLKQMSFYLYIEIRVMPD